MGNCNGEERAANPGVLACAQNKSVRDVGAARSHCRHGVICHSVLETRHGHGTRPSLPP